MTEYREYRSYRYQEMAKVIFVSVTKCDRKHKEGQYRGTLAKNLSDTFMASSASSSFQHDLYFVIYCIIQLRAK